MAHVENHLSIEDLAARYRACEDVCAARHYQTIWLLAQGHTVSAVSTMTSFVPRWIEELLARYNALGAKRRSATCAATCGFAARSRCSNRIRCSRCRPRGRSCSSCRYADDPRFGA